MDTDELEQRLEGGEETQTFDIKAAMVWDVKVLVKHILAMANVRDGGVILIGVGDKTFERQGVTDKQRSTYDLDTMRDQLAKYADPTRVWQFDGNSSTGPETRCRRPSLPDHH